MSGHGSPAECFGSPHAGVPIIEVCTGTCRETVLGMVCGQECARHGFHRGPCLCRQCLTMKIAARLLHRRQRERASSRISVASMEGWAFGRPPQDRRTKTGDRS